MRATELIPVLANHLGVPIERAWVIDRSLADGRLRAKVKGRKPPPMTRREALHFLIACMVETTATRAAESVERWLQYRWEPWRPGDDPGKYGDLIPAKKREQGSAADVGLVEYLLELTAAFGKVINESDDVEFEIHPLQNIAAVSYRSAGKIHYENFLNANEPETYGGLYRSSIVLGGVFQLIAEHTDAPSDASDEPCVEEVACT